MENKHVQIVATIGPATNTKEKIAALITAGMDVARLNFSWGTHEDHAGFIALIREESARLGKKVIILQDLSGPRVKADGGHSYDSTQKSIVTERDRVDLAFGIAHGVEYVAQSFVASAADINELRVLIKEQGSTAKVIAKIERPEALTVLPEIIAASDAIMIARGDLGDAIALETVPDVETDIITACAKAGKPVIVATEMMSSMVTKPRPTRAEVTDVYFAVISGAGAVMLSNETAVGTYPTETVAMMRKIIDDASAHLAKEGKPNELLLL